MSEIRIGTSGWSYAEWVGVFYPSSSTNKLSFYSKIYDTAEIDSTFYAFPSKGLVLGWTRYSPEDFVFSAKLPRTITHEKKLELKRGAEAEMVRFLSLMKPLMSSGKLGPLLIQLPPSFSYGTDFGKLRSFLEVLPDDVKFAVEFRHPSWLREEVWSLLRERNVANVIVDEPLLPPETIVTADFAFIRWHGRGQRPWYNYRYTERELSSWTPKVKEVAGRVKKTYGYFNNHFRGFAVENSLKMMGMLGMSRPEQDEAGEKAKRFLDKGGKKSEEGSMLEFMGGRER
ncbi:MAG: DUF72 domain-containing protein [Nitrososphaerales archaeon]|nr:DUF72 domain-containing protein [Nitrososphaerales archaeon]